MSNVHHNLLSKLDRAGKHISDFEACWAAARATNESEIISKRDAKTGDVSYYVAKLTPIPIGVPLAIGDALQNLRTCLDHLVYALVIRNGGTPTTRTGFPIADSAERYEKDSPRSLNGVHHLATHRINGLNPYKGGNENLWMLHRLNNIDKHRLLLTVAVVPTGQTLLPSEQNFLRNAFRIQNPGAPEPAFLTGVFGIGPRADGRPRILEEGYKLATVPASKAQHNIQFSLDIAFNEAGIVEGRTVFWILRTLQSEVQIIINDFVSFL